MIPAIMAASFPMIWEVEGKPTTDILRHTTSNNPQSVGNLQSIDPYITLAEDVPCIYAGGPGVGQSDDDTTRTDLTLFIRESDMIGFPITLKLIFRHKGRLYKLVEQDPNYIFGLVEFNLLRAD